jgi:diguanylate cyclase (GGDEF)-like protein
LATLGSAVLEVLQAAIASAQPAGRGFALLYIDLDRFQQVDELLGREKADRLLEDAAGRLAAALGPRDRLERLGGDDFVALIDGAGDLDRAAATATRLLEECRREYVYGCIAVRITASIGIGLFPRFADGAEALLRCAERALYRAKVGGRDRYFPQPVPPGLPLAQIYLRG